MSDPQVDRMSNMGHWHLVVANMHGDPIAPTVVHGENMEGLKRGGWKVVEVAPVEQLRGAVSLAALREIAQQMYDGLEVGSPEQLAVSEFLGRAESLGGQ